MKKLQLLIVSVITALTLGLGLSAPAFAVDPLQEACQGAAASSATCQGRSGGASNPLTGPSGVLTKATQIIAIVTGIAAVIMIIIGGFRFVLAGGDVSALTSARKTVIYAAVGAVIAISAQFIVTFVIGKV